MRDKTKTKSAPPVNLDELVNEALIHRNRGICFFYKLPDGAREFMERIRAIYEDPTKDNPVWETCSRILEREWGYKVGGSAIGKHIRKSCTCEKTR